MSESNKFTPGPWFVIEDIRTEGGVEYIAGFNIQTECGDELVGCDGIYGDFGGNRYNANLMGTAPDLLEALENLLWHAEVLEEFIESERGRGRNADQLYADGEMHNYMVEAKASILKARGQQ